jgi:hypothetical protein
VGRDPRQPIEREGDGEREAGIVQKALQERQRGGREDVELESRMRTSRGNSS